MARPPSRCWLWADQLAE
ncbi:hypothetical protein HaLaN_32045, partial [Haematococcus lacustris]